MSKHKKGSDVEEVTADVEVVIEKPGDGIVLAPEHTKWESSNHYADPIEAQKLDAFTVILPWKERNEILAAAQATYGEIAGWCEADVNLVKRTITLGRVAIPEQEAGAANAEILGEQTHELALAGEIALDKAIVSWHSHVNMAAQPSHVDEQSFRKMADMMPVFVGIVMNKKNYWWVEVWIKTSIGPMRFTPKLNFEDPEPAPMPHIEEIVKKRLKERSYKVVDHRRDHQASLGLFASYWNGDKFFINGVQQVWNDDLERFVDAPKGYIGSSGRRGWDPIKDRIDPAVRVGGTFMIWDFLGVKCFAIGGQKPPLDCEETTCDTAATFKLIFSESPGARSYCGVHMSAVREICVRGESKIMKELARRKDNKKKPLLLNQKV